MTNVTRISAMRFVYLGLLVLSGVKVNSGCQLSLTVASE